MDDHMLSGLLPNNNIHARAPAALNGDFACKRIATMLSLAASGLCVQDHPVELLLGDLYFHHACVNPDTFIGDERRQQGRLLASLAEPLLECVARFLSAKICRARRSCMALQWGLENAALDNEMAALRQDPGRINADATWSN